MATTFLKSSSVVAHNPAITIVKRDNVEIDCNIGAIRSLNRRITKTPAVTSVDECTREEMGVGAAIAAGNHDENGNCALFVMAPNLINNMGTKNWFIILNSIDAHDEYIRKINLIINRQSPTRFVKIVTSPDVILDLLL